MDILQNVYGHFQELLAYLSVAVPDDQRLKVMAITSASKDYCLHSAVSAAKQSSGWFLLL